MRHHDLPIVTEASAPRTLHAIRPAELPAFLAGLPPPQAAFLESSAFTAAAQQLVLLPGAEGVAEAALGLGDDRSPYAFGDLPTRLPGTEPWRLAPGDFSATDAALGFCMGAYAFRGFKPPKREPARLVLPEGAAGALPLAGAIWMVRDLVNQPANLLGPAELADAVATVAEGFGAAAFRHDGAPLEQAYPAVAAVGRGSARPPVVAGFRWQGSKATPDSPLVSLCGKGVVFDTGGYDLKPSAGMLRMKKDMGGAATVLGLARVLMQADLPIRLVLRVGCVENSVSGTAMRPSDVIATRRGLSVEIGNTDAEGRLVLADLLAEASDEQPELLVDCATLTGAARVALGPDLPALFCDDDDFAASLVATGLRIHDPLWRLPLWDGYSSWLDSPIADLNNVSVKPMAGAVTAALFLRRFVPPGLRWAHIDVYAWNDATRPGRPEGGEAQGLRALAAAIERQFAVTPP
jgi:leucyl aminopeptidase